MKKITQKLFCLSFALLVQFSFSQSWQTEGPLMDNITANTAFQKLAIDSNNNNYILMLKNTTSQNFVVKYDGNSWSTLGSYIPDGTVEINARPQSITIDNSDNVYVAYVDPSLTNKVVVKKWDSSAWVYVGSNQGIAVNSIGIGQITLKTYNDKVYISYFVPGFGVIVQVFNENTNTWDLVGALNSISSSAGYLDLAINSIGTPYIVYQDVSNNNFTTIKMFDGTNWLLVGSSIPTFGELLNISFKSNDMPIIAYRDGSASRLAIKQFNGAIWSDLGNTPTINPLNSALADISLVLDSNDKPYIAYTEFSTDEYGKVITLDENSNDWVTLQASNVPTGIGVRFNSLYLDSQDVLHYAYQRSAVTKCVVYNVPLSIDKVEKDSLMSLYPNPTSNLFSIETNQPIVEVSIYDVQGKKVKTFNQTNTSYNTEGLTSGIYFVNVKTSKGEVTKKLIKE